MSAPLPGQPCAGASPPRRHIAFVLSREYGELCHTMNFLSGQWFADDAVVLLPEPLYTANQSDLSVACYRYASAREIRAHLGGLQLHAVFLFSAYLYATDRLISPRELAVLLRWLSKRGCRIVTSDPLHGLAATLQPADIRLEPVRRHSAKPSRRAAGRLMLALERRRHARRFARAHRLLRNVPHLYAAPTATIATISAARQASFHNPNIETPAGHRPERSWLFVIGELDLQIQTVRLGVEPFMELVANRLLDAADSGRRATLIGPPGLIAQLTTRVSPGKPIELLEHCGYWRFVSLLLAAEYAFYWNVVSHSVYTRLANGLPLFYFDVGHPSRMIAGLHEVALNCYYAARPPPMLELRQKLDVVELGARAASWEARREQIRQRLRSSPSPQVILQQLLDSGETNDGWAP